MKNIVKSTAVAVCLLALSGGAASAQADTNRQSIEAALQHYEAALNTSDVNKVMNIYAPDAVFMLKNSPSLVGYDAIRAAYVSIFDAIQFEVDFKIQEIVQMAPDWAFVRTNSSEFITVRSTGEREPETNQELFILHKDGGGNWKIARYCFSRTNPARQ